MQSGNTQKHLRMHNLLEHCWKTTSASLQVLSTHPVWRQLTPPHGMEEEVLNSNQSQDTC